MSDPPDPSAREILLSYLLRGIIALAAFVGFNPFCAHAAGELDSSFGVEGKSLVSLQGEAGAANCVAIQADRKIVIAGWRNFGGDVDFLIARLLPSGTLDPSFGNGGIVRTDLGTTTDRATAVAIQPDGKIIAGGYKGSQNNADIALVRYLANGAIDPTFGEGGKVIATVGSREDVCRGIALQRDGKIVVAGHSMGATSSDFAVLRLHSSGELDTSFNGTGKVVTSFLGLEQAYCVAIQRDGKILLAGSTSTNGANYDIAVVRYTVDGALDQSWSADGKAVIAVGSRSEHAYGITCALDGAIYVVGTTATTELQSRFAVLKFTNAGELDVTFNQSGMASPAIGFSDFATSACVQDDGRLIVAGVSYQSNKQNFALARYLPSGSLDSSWNGSGWVVTAFGTNSDQANGIALQSDGRIVVAGSALVNATELPALAGYLPGQLIPVAPFVIEDPENKFVWEGQSVTLEAIVGGSPRPKLTWLHNGTPIAGAEGSALLISAAKQVDAGNYTILAVNASGTTESKTADVTVVDDLSDFGLKVYVYPAFEGVPQDGEDSLVVITHGLTLFGRGFDEQREWLRDMQREIDLKSPSNFLVTAYEWEEESSGTPFEVKSFAELVGPGVGEQIVNKGGIVSGGRWKHVHLIGHSAGCALIHEASRIIRERTPETIIHNTFLDPYTGIKDGGREEYGKHADWSDHYFAYDGTDYVAGRTSGTLANAYNVDVTALDPGAEPVVVHVRGPINYTTTAAAGSSHAWARLFYQQSIADNPSPDFFGHGFALSAEAGAWPLPANRYPKGQPPAKLGVLSSVPLTNPSQRNVIPISFGAEKAFKGNIVTNGLTVEGIATPLVTPGFNDTPTANDVSGGPAWISIPVHCATQPNVLEVKVQFLSNPSTDGILTVHWNGTEIGRVEEKNAGGVSRTYAFEIEGGFLDRNNSLGFRLDAGSGDTKVRVSDSQLSFIGVEAPKVGAMEVSGNNALRLQIQSSVGATLRIECSEDMVDWKVLSYLRLESVAAGIIEDSDFALYPRRFYRAVNP
jgi:uncharacterized delta-60 repeat protein